MTLVTSDATASTVEILPEATAAASSRPASMRVPFVMPSDQEYYWRFTWQNEERQCLVELHEGRSVKFDSEDPGDAARWLLEPDDS